MPKYFEFVFAAYAIWIAAFLFYFFHLYLKTRRTDRALRTLTAQDELSDSSGKPLDAS